jgi:hypothetical protein
LVRVCANTRSDNKRKIYGQGHSPEYQQDQGMVKTGKLGPKWLVVDLRPIDFQFVVFWGMIE